MAYPGRQGMAKVPVDVLSRAHSVTPVAAVQNLYSIVERDCEKDIFPFCLENGIVVVPFSPVASGFLSGKVTVDTKFEGDDVRRFVPQLSKENLISNQPVLDVISGFAERKKATNAQISLAWMLHKYSNVIPVPGSKNKERIIENLSVWNVTLTGEEFAELEAALDKCRIFGHRGHVETEQSSFGKTGARNKLRAIPAGMAFLLLLTEKTGRGKIYGHLMKIRCPRCGHGVDGGRSWANQISGTDGITALTF